uniref:Ig-like domain-containing protein n=1 Tax=Erpetoichthys calabaricus TaxID=27687 RepID=A0A8C4XHK5_ERPCA
MSFKSLLTLVDFSEHLRKFIEITGKEYITLVCLATDFYPDHIELSWKINNKERISGVKSDHNAVRLSTGNYSISSRLRIRKREWCNEDNVFTCVTKFYNDTDNAVFIQDYISGKGTDYVNSVKFAYILFTFKSILYGLLITFLIWKLKVSVYHTSQKMS